MSDFTNRLFSAIEQKESGAELPAFEGTPNVDPYHAKIWEEHHIPWYKKLLEFVTMYHVEYPEAPTARAQRAEVERIPGTTELITRAPRTAALGIEEDPMVAVGAGIAGAVKTAPFVARLLSAVSESLGFATGGITDIPRIAAGGIKQIPKVARGVAAKELEKTMAPAAKTAEKGLGVTPTRAAPTKPVAGPISAAERVTELTRRQFEEKFLAKPMISPKPKPKLPEFKETGEAIRFGQKADKEQVGQLYKAYKASIEKQRGIKDPQLRMDEATKGQYYREAIEAAQKKIKPRKLKPKDIDDTNTLYGGLPINPMGLARQWEKLGTKVFDDWIMTKIPKALEKVPGGKSINRALLEDYRGDLPNTAKFLSSAEDMRLSQGIGREYAVDLGTRLQKFDEATQIKMGQYITAERFGLMNREAKAVADEARRAMYDLGKQAVDAGLLAEGTFFKHAGKYMPRLYTSKEYAGLLAQFKLRKPTRLDLSRFKRRKDIPKEIRKAMGEILTPGYPIAKGIVQLTHDISMSRHFSGIAANPEWAIPGKKFQVLAADMEAKTWGLWDGKKILGVYGDRKAAGTALKEAKTQWAEANPIPGDWKQLSTNKRLGDLSGAWVHPEIHKELETAVEIMTQGTKYWNKALGSWKFGKVILSPKTHSRNLMSNSVLAHLGGMPMPMQPYYLAKAAFDMKKKGPHWKAIREMGGLEHTWVSGELKQLFDGINLGDVRAGSMAEKMGKAGNALAFMKKTMKKAANVYEFEEQWFKVAKYMHNIERRGMTKQAAWKDAEKWLFNYSKLTPAKQAYRSKWYGAPFATFTLKAMPRIAEAWIKTPWRFALPAAMIYGMEEAARRKFGDTWEQRKAKEKLRPEWQQGRVFWMPNFVSTPKKDELGREYNLNLTYILPWGDIGEGGKFGPIPGGITPFSQPFVKEPMSQILNYDSFWKEEIVKEVETAGLPGAAGKKPSELWKPTTEAGRVALLERGKHAWKTFMPTPAIDIEKIWSAFRNRPDYRGRFRDRTAALLDAFAGIKLYPVDYKEQMAKRAGKKDPADFKQGYLIRKLMSRMRTLAIKKKAALEKKKDVSIYDKQMDKIKRQIEGIAKELEEEGKAYKKIK